MFIDEIYDECIETWDSHIKKNKDSLFDCASVDVNPSFYYEIHRLSSRLGKVTGYTMCRILDKYCKQGWYYKCNSTKDFKGDLQRYEFSFFNINI